MDGTAPALRAGLGLLAALALAALGCGDRDLEPPPAGEDAPAPAVFGLFAAHAAEMQVESLGALRIRSGQIGVSDRLVSDAPVRVGNVAAGEYPVEALLTRSGEEARCAAARITLAPGAPVRWTRLGYVAVDSGSAALFDASLAGSWSAFVLARLPIETARWITLSTGLGEGSYPVLLGRSAHAEPLVVLVDFRILRRLEIVPEDLSLPDPDRNLSQD